MTFEPGSPTMTRAVRSASAHEYFRPAAETFEAMLRWADSFEAPMDHGDFEPALGARMNEVARRAYQGRLDRISSLEYAEWIAAGSPKSEGEEVRQRTRQVETSFGRLTFRRLGYKIPGQVVRFPADERLNLPADTYTHPLRERVAEEAVVAGFDHAVERIDRTTGGHVPKRQVEELTVAAAQDFEKFYARSRPVNDVLGEGALLLASSDGKGIRMLPKALREATRKAKEDEEAEAVRGDPMAKKKPRSHDKRMAMVTAVWEQTPMPRTAMDIVSALRRAPQSSERPRTPKLPRPHNKRVSATVMAGVVVSVSSMFDELDRRDPTRTRRANILVDGEESQQGAILTQGLARQRPVMIVLDIIHVIHYLWLAGSALCRKDEKATDVWLAKHLLMLLSNPVDQLIDTLEQAVAAKRLTGSQRRPIDKALKYFRRNKSFMDYQTALSQGLPIASGVIEGACRHLVQDRLGITGARWDLPSAEAVLRLRAVRASGDWNDYWRFHREQEQTRNYANAAA